VLKNPSYAGVYAFGRYRSSKQISSDGEVRVRTRRVAMDHWQVVLHEHHPGYILRDPLIPKQFFRRKRWTVNPSA